MEIRALSPRRPRGSLAQPSDISGSESARSDRFTMSSVSCAIPGGISADLRWLPALRLLAETVSRAPREHCPSHPRDFVGQSDDGDILVTALHEPLQPYGLSVGSPSDKSDHCSSALDQHGSQVHVPAFRNATKRYPPATGALPRRQTGPRRKLPAVPELPRVAHRAD